MNSRRTYKKNLIVSYKNLSDELKAIFKEHYPEGHTDYLQRYDKPNGETIFVVPMETEDTAYMVKFDVKIDTSLVEADLDTEPFDDSGDKGDDEFAPLEEAMDKEEENFSHTERVIHHGACEIDFDDDEPKKKKKKIASGDLSALGEELAAAFKDDFDDEDIDDEEEEEDEDSEFDDEKEDRDESEPTDEELMDIDSEIFKNAEIPPEELARMEAEGALAPGAQRKRGRPRKYPPAPEKPKTGKRGRPKKNQE